MLKRSKRLVAVLVVMSLVLSVMSVSVSAAVDIGIPLNYYNSGVVTLPSNDYDVYSFTVPTARTYALSFSTGNPNMRAVLFDGTLTTAYTQFADGTFTTLTLPVGSWCWVVLPVSGSVGGAYQLICNGSNPSGLTGITATTNLSTVQGTLNGVLYVNGVAQNPPQPNYVVTINPNGFSGGTANISYKNYGTRYRIDQKKTLTVTGTVTNNGVPAAGVSITVLIEDKHWSLLSPGTIAANTPYRYSVATVTTNNQGNFTAYVTANNAIGVDYINLPGSPYPKTFNHYFDYETKVYAYPTGDPIPTSGGIPIYIYAYSEIA